MKDDLNNIILLGAGFTTRNMGVWALASGAFTAVWHAYPDARISLLDYNKNPEIYKLENGRSQSNVELLNIRFSKRFWLPNNIARLLFTAFLIKIVPSRSFRNMLCNHSAVLRHIQNMDVAGSIAGGDSFSDIYGIARLIYVTLPQILMLLMDKPLILLPQTIGPFKSVFGKNLARFILKRATRVFARDMESLNKAYELIGKKYGRVSFCYDMGFVLKPWIDKRKIPSWLADMGSGLPVIGINVSGLLYAGGYKGDNMFGLKSDYRKTIAALIEHFAQQYGAHIILVPHVKGNGKSRESDVAACNDIFENAEKESKGRLHVVGAEYDHREIKALIGRCNFFLGSRMHACIAALSQGIPAVGLAYSRKFSGVYESIGVRELVLDLREHDECAVIVSADRLFQQRFEFGLRLKEKMREVRKGVCSLFTEGTLRINREIKAVKSTLTIP